MALDLGGGGRRANRSLGRAVLFLTRCPGYVGDRRGMRVPRAAHGVVLAGAHVRDAIRPHDCPYGGHNRSIGAAGIPHDGGAGGRRDAACVCRCVRELRFRTGDERPGLVARATTIRFRTMSAAPADNQMMTSKTNVPAKSRLCSGTHTTTLTRSRSYWPVNSQQPAGISGMTSIVQPPKSGDTSRKGSAAHSACLRPVPRLIVWLI